MEFNDIMPDAQEIFLELLKNHLHVSKTWLEKDKYVLPILIKRNARTQENTITLLQPKSGNTDVDVAFAVAVEMLKKECFENAIFTYSTKIGLKDGNFTDALKTVIFLESGLTVAFFTPYKISGLFKKKIDYERSVIGEITENALL